MVIHGTTMSLQGRAEESRGKCPFEPTLNYASVFVEPSFVSMEIVRESESNPNGDDDKIYVFFTETAVEFDFYDKCIDNFARSIGYNTSSDLPDKVLQFVRDHPLMDNSVNPVGDGAVLLKRGSNYTRIVVDRVTGLDKQTYDVMFLGTDDGYLHKALSCDGEMFIVEELQLFLSPAPVQSLRLSSGKVQLLALHMESGCCNSLSQALLFWVVLLAFK
ncbi:semaphorihypothetical protein [Limosa lapponica baueri]|uniref:Sema domain-containing protein n=1 Tax=Limosa lapponica baueri TaxID=1758121 RepID=A0A2I0TB92_LIMLA|nr:semaphorihypothetical protein [Limosa lapponica baueri]